jgi:lipoate-protein ligase A
MSVDGCRPKVVPKRYKRLYLLIITGVYGLYEMTIDSSIHQSLINPLPGRTRKNDDIFACGAAGEMPFAYLYEQQHVEVVHGPSFVAEKEVFVDRCAVDGVPITERRGGGGTVVLSPGTLVIIAVGEQRGGRELAQSVFHRVNGAVIAALRMAGIDNAVEAGISDIAVGGRKALGSSLYMGSKPPLFYYQSSLMVSNDLMLMDRYLRHPPREPSYREGRGHGEFCTTLRECGLTVRTDELIHLIEAELMGRLGA